MRSFRPLDWKEFLKRLAGESLDSPGKAASAAALGVFFGIAPFWGLQLILAMLAASVLKVNRVIAGAATNISVPPLIPFIIFASLKIGALVLGRPFSMGSFTRTGALQMAKNCAAQYLVGSLFLALFCTLIVWLLAYVAAAMVLKRKASLQKSL